jgi:predicted PurR-regulated permease PerM
VVLLGAALVWALRDLLVLAGLAVLLAYALDPFVSRLEQVPLPRGGHISRGFSAAIVMLLVAAAAGGFLYLTLPRLAAEFGHFLQKIPGSLQQMLNEIRAYAA